MKLSNPVFCQALFSRFCVMFCLISFDCLVCSVQFVFKILCFILFYWRFPKCRCVLPILVYCLWSKSVIHVMFLFSVSCYLVLTSCFILHLPSSSCLIIWLPREWFSPVTCFLPSPDCSQLCPLTFMYKQSLSPFVWCEVVFVYMLFDSIVHCLNFWVQSIFCSLFMLQVQINNLDFSSSITGSFLHLHRVISGLGFCHLPRCDRSFAHGHLCWQKRQRLFLRKYFCTCLNGTWQFYSLKEATVSVQCKSH